jgi:hypothetical protein
MSSTAGLTKISCSFYAQLPSHAHFFMADCSALILSSAAAAASRFFCLVNLGSMIPTCKVLVSLDYPMKCFVIFHSSVNASELFLNVPTYPTFPCYNLHPSPLSKDPFSRPNPAQLEILFPTKKRGNERTILNNLQAGSLGCAPTPNQYFALETSNLISLNFLRFSGFDGCESEVRSSIEEGSSCGSCGRGL